LRGYLVLSERWVVSHPMPDFAALSKRSIAGLVAVLVAVAVTVAIYTHGNDVLRSCQRTIERVARAATAEGHGFDYLRKGP
jgi:hypothetical protein